MLLENSKEPRYFILVVDSQIIDKWLINIILTNLPKITINLFENCINLMCSVTGIKTGCLRTMLTDNRPDQKLHSGYDESLLYCHLISKERMNWIS